MKVVVSANLALNLYSRKNLLLALKADGWEIHAAACADEGVSLLENDLAIPFHALPMENKGKGVFSDIRTFCAFFSLYRRLKPDTVLHYNSKPDIYGSFAANLLKIPAINNITGLGSVYVGKKTLVRIVVNFLYKVAFSGKKIHVFFQNKDDLSLFLDLKIVQESKTGLLPGSGVDINRFRPELNKEAQNKINRSKKTTFLFASRLVLSKGIREFIEAATILKKECENYQFEIIGELLSVTGFISQAELDTATQSGAIVYLGNLKDATERIQNCDCMVLPSYYREGVPRILLEAAAMGKPLIAANSIGTKEPVEHGINGFLCIPESTPDLIKQMQKFLALSPEEQCTMGKESRKIAETRYSDTIISQSYLNILRRKNKT